MSEFDATLIGYLIFGLGIIITLFLKINKPIVNLTNVITKFEVVIDNLTHEMSEMKKTYRDEVKRLELKIEKNEEKNSESHREIYERLRHLEKKD